LSFSFSSLKKTPKLLAFLTFYTAGPASTHTYGIFTVFLFTICFFFTELLYFSYLIIIAGKISAFVTGMVFVISVFDRCQGNNTSVYESYMRD